MDDIKLRSHEEALQYLHEEAYPSEVKKWHGLRDARTGSNIIVGEAEILNEVRGDRHVAWCYVWQGVPNHDGSRLWLVDNGRYYVTNADETLTTELE